jgi:hypothetical protein
MPSRAERQAEAANRRARVAHLRLAGASFEEIGRQLGISDTRAHQLWTDALKQTVKEPVDAQRTLELQRLDALQVHLTQVLRRNHVTISGGKVVADTDGQPYRDDGPVVAAALALVRVQESRRKLLGLDPPSRADVTARVHAEVYSLDALDRQLEQLNAELAEQDPQWAEHERRRQDLDRRLTRFRVTWSTPGQVVRDLAGFVGDGLALLLEGLDLADDQREAAAVEVERFLLSRTVSP